MKNSKRFFVYAVCILLSVVIACPTVMVGATDESTTESAATTVESTTEKPTGNDLLYTEPPIPTEKDITDTISEIVSENGWEDDLSEIGKDISEGSVKAENFLTKLIEKLENAFETFIEFFKKIFNFF